MIVNRLDLMRIIRIVHSVGVSEVRLDENGYYGVPYPDGSGFHFGKGLALGKKVALLDTGVFRKMLDSFAPAEINVEITDRQIMMTSGDVKFGYTMADWDLVDAIEHSKKPEIESSWEWSKTVLTYEDLSRIKKLIEALGEPRVSFREVSGKMVVCVGDRDLYFGEIELAGMGLKEELSFVAADIGSVISVLDESRVGFSLGVRVQRDEALKEDYLQGFLRIVNGEFSWYIGSEKSKK
jgi:hypothetical protein